MLELVINNPRKPIDFRPPAVIAKPIVSTRIEIVPTTYGHLRTMESDMRPADLCEIAGLGVTVRKALWQAYRRSPICKTAIVDGSVAAVWGVCVGLRGGAGLLGNAGVPWLHTTAAVEKMPVSFIKIAKTELAAIVALYPRLESYVAAEYVGAVGLLKLLGFSVDEALPVGANGALYRRFHLGCD
jgi:hypothetical protein